KVNRTYCSVRQTLDSWIAGLRSKQYQTSTSNASTNNNPPSRDGPTKPPILRKRCRSTVLPHAPAKLVARSNFAKRLECGGSPPLSKEPNDAASSPKNGYRDEVG